MEDKQTALDWFENKLRGFLLFEDMQSIKNLNNIFQQAKEREQIDIDNKVIHFAEWLTKKHTTELITLYKQFKETE